jgi:hypothetical protein
MVRRWKDVDAQNISTYFFGYDTIESEFQERLVNRYLPLLPMVRRIKGEERKIKILDVALSLSLMCKHYDGARDKYEKEVFRRHAESSMKYLGELVEILFKQEQEMV